MIEIKVQYEINKCSSLDDIVDVLEDNIWRWNEGDVFTFSFKGEDYEFWVADSGKSDEPQNGNYLEIRDLQKK